MRHDGTIDHNRARGAKAVSPRLDEHDAALVKGMLARGDRQHDIAAWFGVNGGRIAEIATGAAFTWVIPIHDDLPPPGPYPTGKQVIEMQKALADVRAALTIAESQLRHGLLRNKV